MTHPTAAVHPVEHEAREAPPRATVEVAYLDPDRSIRRIVGEAWQRRAMLGLLAGYLLRQRYSKTYLGRAWMFVRPGVDVGGGALLFGGVLTVGSGDDTPYLLFFLAGFLAWRGFERTILWVTRSFDRFRVTKKLDVPLLLIPLAGCSPALFDVGVYLAFLLLAVLGYLVIDGHMWMPLGPQLLAGVAGLSLCLVFALSIGLFTSVLNAQSRDIRQVMRYLLQVWLVVTPVIYPISKLPSSLQSVAQANPMAAPIELVKYGLVGSGSVQLISLLWSCVAACLLTVAGLWFFSRRASNFTGMAGLRADEDDDEEESLL